MYEKDLEVLRTPVSSIEYLNHRFSRVARMHLIRLAAREYDLVPGQYRWYSEGFGPGVPGVVTLELDFIKIRVHQMRERIPRGDVNYDGVEITTKGTPRGYTRGATTYVGYRTLVDSPSLAAAVCMCTQVNAPKPGKRVPRASARF